MAGVFILGCGQSSSPTNPAELWKPGLNITWNWLVLLTPNLSTNPELYTLDLFGNDASTVAALHQQGKRAVCYISAGSWENWREDQARFPLSVLGKDYVGFEGEKWLDIRQIEILAPILRNRFDLCKAKGFDGIEPDNIDGYTNDTGFPLTYQDQLNFNRWLAQEAHQRGLAIALKNDREQVSDLLADYDWAVTEECFFQGWCEQMLPFLQAQKAVLDIEYTDTGLSLSQFCPQASALKINTILKNRNVDEDPLRCP